LKRIIHGHDALLDGGLQSQYLSLLYHLIADSTFFNDNIIVDGSEIRPINEQQLRAECQVVKSKGLTNIVLVGVFSPLAAEGTQEDLAKEIILNVLGPNVNVVCSSKG
jgi:N-methylhydantoinase A/oxoprolinase/acetone carboxylase beta subunit